MLCMLERIDETLALYRVRATVDDRCAIDLAEDSITARWIANTTILPGMLSISSIAAPIFATRSSVAVRLGAMHRHCSVREF